MDFVVFGLAYMHAVALSGSELMRNDQDVRTCFRVLIVARSQQAYLHNVATNRHRALPRSPMLAVHTRAGYFVRILRRINLLAVLELGSACLQFPSLSAVWREKRLNTYVSIPDVFAKSLLIFSLTIDAASTHITTINSCYHAAPFVDALIKILAISPEVWNSHIVFVKIK
jgi:hypothetical protein